MEQRDLNRMFDALAPSQEQEQAVLDRLLQTERKGSPMKKLKKLTVLGIAAALMVISCAAAVVTGLDQRLADYFGASPEQAEQLSTAAATQDPVSHTYDSGWTVQISQVLSDRYMVAALIDFTAPEGMVLPIPEDTELSRELTLMVDYRIEDKNGNLIASWKDAPRSVKPDRVSEGGGLKVYTVESWPYEKEGDGLANCLYLEDSEPEQGRISVMWKYVRGTKFQNYANDELLGARVSIIPKGMTFRSTHETVYFAEEAELWSYDITLSESDSGSLYSMETPLKIAEHEVELKTIYLSPLELAYEFQRSPELPSSYAIPLYDKEARAYAINLADGSSVAVKDNFGLSATASESGEGINHVGLYPVEFIDPEKVVSFSLFGQTFELN